MRVFEYEVDCEQCGGTFTVGLTRPAEQIDPESLGVLLLELHPDCPAEKPRRRL